jgi:hypothetical protein
MQWAQLQKQHKAMKKRRQKIVVLLYCNPPTIAAHFCSPVREGIDR